MIDPCFIEKLIPFSPEKHDRETSTEFLSQYSFGFYSLIDQRTNDKTWEIWKEFISSMNLRHTSKNLELIKQSALSFVKLLKSGEDIDIW